MEQVHRPQNALILVSSVMTCLMGAFQVLAEPMILAFSDSATLGICETICASGMLVSSLFLGIRGIRKGYVKTLSLSLVLAGAAMVGFGLRENPVLLCASGFCFFTMLPFANNSLDYLVRTNINACSPEKSSFKAVFTDIKLTECQWQAHNGQKPNAD